MKCEFCGSEIPYNTSQCPSCGAPCENIPAPAPQAGHIDTETEDDDSGAVKKLTSADISFLKQSNDHIYDMVDMEEDEDDGENDGEEEDGEENNKPHSRTGCIVLLCVAVPIVILLIKVL